jgi:hypothetical protein
MAGVEVAAAGQAGLIKGVFYLGGGERAGGEKVLQESEGLFEGGWDDEGLRGGHKLEASGIDGQAEGGGKGGEVGFNDLETLHGGM